MATILRQTGLVDPRVTTVQASIDMATRPHTLDGLTVALLNNGKSHADLVLDATHRLLMERYHLQGTKNYEKGTPGAASRTFPLEIIEDIADQCQVVINALSD
jgi:hypothetical protein